MPPKPSNRRSRIWCVPVSIRTPSPTRCFSGTRSPAISSPSMRIIMRGCCAAPSGCSALRRSHPENGKLGIGEIAKPRPARTLEIFSAPRLAVDACKASDWTVGVEDDDRAATSQQIAPDRAGASDVVGNPVTEAELKRGQGNNAAPLSQGKENEGNNFVRRAANKTEAAVAGMALEH